jgi:hypothetical protein
MCAAAPDWRYPDNSDDLELKGLINESDEEI